MEIVILPRSILTTSIAGKIFAHSISQVICELTSVGTAVSVDQLALSGHLSGLKLPFVKFSVWPNLETMAIPCYVFILSNRNNSIWELR